TAEGISGDQPALRVDLTDRQLDTQPGLVLRLKAPDPGHLREAVALDHGNRLLAVGELAREVPTVDGAEREQREVRLIQDASGERVHLRELDTVDGGEHLVERDELAEAQLLLRHAIHARRGRLEREHEAALEVLLRATELIGLDAVLLERPELLH